jgi:hypothetical protein
LSQFQCLDCSQLQIQQSSQRCVELQAHSVSETAWGITCSTAHFERLIQGHKLRWQIVSWFCIDSVVAQHVCFFGRQALSLFVLFFIVSVAFFFARASNGLPCLCSNGC